jgi:alpha-ketoglutaric semialdehyde dehydrogenase
MITGKNYIGNHLSARGKKTYKTFNPLSNTQNPYVFTEATKQEIDDALKLAAEAFKRYRTMPGMQKSEFLNSIADEILALDEGLVRVYCSESGLTKKRALAERSRTIFQLQSFANLVKEESWVEAVVDYGNSKRKPLPKPDLRKMNIPIGPIAVFGASNFPLAYSTAGGDTASALASGCPVVVKSHPMHSGTGELVASAIIKAATKTEMPNGVFSNLNSSGIEVGEYLVKHPEVKAIGFTGSLAGGRALFNAAAQREQPIPVFAEMGSINPVVILPEALRENNAKIASDYANSITLDSGQFCTNPGLILSIESEELELFIERLSSEILKKAPSCMLHPNIKNAFEANRSNALKQNHVKLAAETLDNIQDNYAKPTVVTVDGLSFLKNPILHREVFGPFSMVVKCKDINQLETVINALEGQLTGTIIAHHKEAQRHRFIVEALKNKVGRLIYNGVPTGVEVCDAMVHGGPYPATTDSRFTAVGVNSIKRWVRPFTYQNWPNALLPDALKDENPLGIKRKENGV